LASVARHGAVLVEEAQDVGGKDIELYGIHSTLGKVATELEASKLLYHKAAEAFGTPEGPVMAAPCKSARQTFPIWRSSKALEKQVNSERH
jgi:hypothetical protein